MYNINENGRIDYSWSFASISDELIKRSSYNAKINSKTDSEIDNEIDRVISINDAVFIESALNYAFTDIMKALSDSYIPDSYVCDIKTNCSISFLFGDRSSSEINQNKTTIELLNISLFNFLIQYGMLLWQVDVLKSHKEDFFEDKKIFLALDLIKTTSTISMYGWKKSYNISII